MGKFFKIAKDPNDLSSHHVSSSLNKNVKEDTTNKGTQYVQDVTHNVKGVDTDTGQTVTKDVTEGIKTNKRGNRAKEYFTKKQTLTGSPDQADVSEAESIKKGPWGGSNKETWVDADGQAWKKHSINFLGLNLGGRTRKVNIKAHDRHLSKIGKFFKTAAHDMREGSMVEDINPTCPHHGAKGKVIRAYPNEVTFIVINKGKNYRPGDKLTKTISQMEKTGIAKNDPTLQPVKINNTQLSKKVIDNSKDKTIADSDPMDQFRSGVHVDSTTTREQSSDGTDIYKRDTTLTSSDTGVKNTVKEQESTTADGKTDRSSEHNFFQGTKDQTIEKMDTNPETGKERHVVIKRNKSENAPIGPDGLPTFSENLPTTKDGKPDFDEMKRRSESFDVDSAYGANKNKGQFF